MKNLTKCEDRLKAMVIFDKQDVPQRITKVIKAEVLFLLRNYFEICAEDLSVDIIINNSGKYELQIYAESRHVKNVQVFGD